jgi:hypothetical protein
VLERCAIWIDSEQPDHRATSRQLQDRGKCVRGGLKVDAYDDHIAFRVGYQRLGPLKCCASPEHSSGWNLSIQIPRDLIELSVHPVEITGSLEHCIDPKQTKECQHYLPIRELDTEHFGLEGDEECHDDDQTWDNVVQLE